MIASDRSIVVAPIIIRNHCILFVICAFESAALLLLLREQRLRELRERRCLRINDRSGYRVSRCIVSDPLSFLLLNMSCYGT